MPLDPALAADFMKDDREGKLKKKEIAVKYGLRDTEIAEERRKYAKSRRKTTKSAKKSSQNPANNPFERYRAEIAELKTENLRLEGLVAQLETELGRLLVRDLFRK